MYEGDMALGRADGPGESVLLAVPRAGRVFYGGPRLTRPATDLGADSRDLHALRVAKVARVWRALRPSTYDADLVEFFVTEHEDAGMGEETMYSLAYAWVNSSLNPRMKYSAGGMTSRGLMDCSWSFAKSHRAELAPLTTRAWGPSVLYDPRVSIACHVLEAGGHHRNGRRGYSLLRAVFWPHGTGSTND